MSSSPNARNPDADVWHAFHYSVLCDVPHAVDIFSLLTASGFSFPRYPLFDCETCELRSYRIVHEAWRQGLAVVFFMTLRAWRRESRLTERACSPDFQQMLLETLRANRERGSASWITLSNWWKSGQIGSPPPDVQQVIESIGAQVEFDGNSGSAARAA